MIKVDTNLRRVKEDNWNGYIEISYVRPNPNGDHVLISEKEWSNVAEHFLELQKENLESGCKIEQLQKELSTVRNKLENLSQQVSNISKSLRHVCLETESPIHFS